MLRDVESPGRRLPSAARTITVLAVGLLVLDGVLLCLAGFWTGRVTLALAGAFFMLCAGLVVRYWRRTRRKLQEIAADQTALRSEMAALSEALRRGDSGDAGQRERPHPS